MSDRTREAIAAIDASIQFAPKACREAMELARAVLGEAHLNVAQATVIGLLCGRAETWREAAESLRSGGRAAEAVNFDQQASAIEARITPPNEAATPSLLDRSLTPEREIAYLMLRLKPHGAPIAHRRRLPDNRQSVTHRFTIDGSKGWITIGEYEDGTPGELFIRFGEEDVPVGQIDEDRVRKILASRNALADQFAIAVSMLFQTGTTLQTLADKFRFTNFPPQGFTGNEDVPNAKSLLDYVFAWAVHHYLSEGGEAKAIEPAVDSVKSPRHAIDGAIAALVAHRETLPIEGEVMAAGGERVIDRCLGDGEHGCGHTAHSGRCPKKPYSTEQCSCTGTPGL